MKKRLTVALTCVGNGDILPAVVVFKGKMKLKFAAPPDVKPTVQAKAWMDSELMIGWFKSVILRLTQKVNEVCW